MKCAQLSFTAMIVLLPALLAVHTARADENIAAIRSELDALKTQYETRIQALEQRLNAAEQQLAQEQKREPASIEPAQTDYAGTDYAPVGNSYAASGNQYNPAMGIILNGALRTYEHDPKEHFIPGFPAGGEAGLADEGLSVGESEFVFTANVDDWFYGRVTLAVEQEDGDFETGLEEAFLDTLSMPANTTLRFGRFYSSVGYLNDKHFHTWAFADQALPYSALMGNQYGDDGIQLRWLAPTDFYLELGAEVFRGSNYPAAGDAHNGLGTQSLFAHIGGDVGFSNSWSAGISWLGADARDRNSGDEDDPLRFDGDSDTYIADFIWKWAPNGNIRDRNLTFQTEYLWRKEDGSYLPPGLTAPISANNDSSGWYAQLIYQWRPRWRTGLRIDGLSLDDPGTQFAGTPLDSLGDDPLRYSLMFDYSNSEFSRIRLQFNRDESGLKNDNQFTLQYIMSIGAHGGHAF
jgi:hypothetical protein